MTLLIVKNDRGYEYVEYKGVVLTYEETREEGYGEYDSFDMNPAALNGMTTVYHTYKIGDFETKHIHDIDGPSSHAPHPQFYARDCEDGKSFEIIKKYPNSEEVLGTVNFEPTFG